MLRVFLVPVSIFLLAACGGGQGGSAPVNSTSTLFVVGAVGDSCVVDGDCELGTCDRTVPGGYCTAQCSSHDDCGGGWCDAELGSCFAPCVAQRQCRSAAFQCFEVVAGEQGVCSFDVNSVDRSAPNVGAPCSADIECVAPAGLQSHCFAERDLGGRSTGFSEGTCTALGCSSDADCGAGAGCVSSGAAAICLAACGADDDCRRGYTCDLDLSLCVPEREDAR